MTETTLERRYRRLLSCYPAAYRTEYGEEMIGVLLASTQADQDRPTKADAFDLIGGGLRAWLRLLRTGDGDSPWRNTLAVFSVIAPVLVFISVAGGYVTSIVFDNTFPFAGRRTGHPPEAVIAATIALAAVVICPFLARRGRVAAMTATALVVIALAGPVVVMFAWFEADGFVDSWGSYLGFVLVFEMVALLFSPGPGRGWQLLGRRGLIVLIATAAALAASAGLQIASTMDRSGLLWGDLWDVGNSINAIAPVLGVMLIAITLRWPAGGRLLAVFAIPCYLLSGYNAAQWLASYVYPVYWRLPVVAAEIKYVPVVTIAALIAIAVWRSSRRRRPRIPGATG